MAPELHIEGDKASFITPSGRAMLVPRDKVSDALREGWQPEGSDAFFARKKQEAAAENPGAAFALGAGRGLTLGLTDVIGRAAGGDAFTESAKLLDQENPLATGGGEALGAAASFLLPGGVLGAAGKAGTKAAAALTTKAAAKGIASRAGAKLASATLPLGAAGAAAGVGEGISDVALAAQEVSIGEAAKRIAETSTRGALMGGAFGMGGSVAAVAGRGAASLATSANRFAGNLGRRVLGRTILGPALQDQALGPLGFAKRQILRKAIEGTGKKAGGVLAEGASRAAPGNAGGFLARALGLRQSITQKLIDTTVTVGGKVLAPAGRALAVGATAATATDASEFAVPVRAALQAGLIAPDSGPEQLIEGIDRDQAKRVRKSTITPQQIELLTEALSIENDSQVEQVASIGYAAAGLEPEAAGAFTRWQLTRRQLLRENLPDGKDQLQRFRFEKVFDAVSEPRNIFARMERNQLNQQDVEVLARLYPKIHAQLAEAATAVLADRRATALTPPRRETLELLSGGLNIQKRNARIKVIQSSFKSKEEREKQQGQSKASRPRADFKTPDLSTGTQRTFQRGGD